MGENGGVSYTKLQLDKMKEFWKGKCSLFLDINRLSWERPPRWSDSDVEEFIASDSVHGPTLQTIQEAAKCGVYGGIIGAVSTASFAWKYSKSPHGALLSLGAGAVFGGVFGLDIANHWFQLYRHDTVASRLKFFEWWDSKTQGRS